MTKLLRVVIALELLTGSAAPAQAPANGSSAPSVAQTAKLLQGDFAVPDAPALKMLDLEDSKLLRPSTVKALAVQLGSASGQGTFLPKAFAVEFSPGLLVKGEQLSLRDYQQNKFWYRTRFSAATKRSDDVGARTQVALALRITLQDQSDLRTNEKYINAILKLTDWKRDSITLFKEAQMAEGVPLDAELNDEQRAKVEARVAAQLSNHAKESEAVARAAEEARWNASVFDFALGSIASSKDSTGSGLRYDGIASWLTKGWAVMPHAQLLIGARGAYERDLQDTVDVKLRGTGDAIIRLYAGSNRYKMQLDAQATGRANSAPQWLASLGGELQLTPVIWMTASAGWQTTGSVDNARFTSSFKLKFNPRQ